MFQFEAANENWITSHKLYLQVQLSGGFWETHKAMDEIEYTKDTNVWDNEIKNLLNVGYKVRVLTVIVEQRETITEYGI